MGEDSIVMIVGVEYELQAHAFLLNIFGSNSIIEVDNQRVGLVPNVQETHQDIVFKCLFKKEEPTNLYCAQSGQNLFSYLTKYELDLKPTSTGSFIKTQRLQSKFRNVVNLKPVRIDFHSNFISFMVKNRLPLAVDQKPTFNKFFQDGYLCLIYKTDSSVHAKTDPLEDDERDVYKVLTSSDLGVSNQSELKRLDPKLFKDKEGKLKLGINVGVYTTPVRVFNLDGLKLEINIAKIKAYEDFDIKFRGIDDAERSYNASNFIMREPKPDPKPVDPDIKPVDPDIKPVDPDIKPVDPDIKPVDPDIKPNPDQKQKGDEKPTSKSWVWILLGVIILVVVTGGVAAFLIKKNNQQVKNFEAHMDDVEKSMQEHDESAEYTKL